MSDADMIDFDDGAAGRTAVVSVVGSFDDSRHFHAVRTMFIGMSKQLSSTTGFGKVDTHYDMITMCKGLSVWNIRMMWFGQQLPPWISSVILQWVSYLVSNTDGMVVWSLEPYVGMRNATFKMGSSRECSALPEWDGRTPHV